MDNNQLLIKAILDKSGIKKDLAEIQKLADKCPIELDTKLKTAKTKAEMQELAKLFSKTFASQGIKVTENQISSALRSLSSQADALTSSLSNPIDKTKRLLALDAEREKIARGLSSYLSGNSRLTLGRSQDAKQLRDEILHIQNAMTGLNINDANFETQFAVLNDNLQTAKKRVKELGLEGHAATDKIKSALSKARAFLGLPQLSALASDQLKSAVSELKEIDAILTDIGKANHSLSKNKLEQIGNNAYDAASGYGVKAADYLASVRDMARAGYDEPEKIAQLSAAAQGAGGITAELANQFIAAANDAYRMNGSIKELSNALDGVNYIASRNALNMTDLAQGMVIASAQAAALGIDADETAAMIAAMIAATGQSGEKAGQALSDALLNIQQAVDTDMNTEEISDYEKACSALNVSLKETKNGIASLRDPMDVIKELAVEYNKLDSNDVKRTNLLDAVGGGAQAETLNAILENYGLYSKMLHEYAKGSGFMAIEAKKNASSLEGSVNKLSNSWTGLINAMANRDGIVTGVNALNNLLSVTEKIISVIDPLPTLIGAIYTADKTKNGGGLIRLIPSTNLLS